MRCRLNLFPLPAPRGARGKDLVPALLVCPGGVWGSLNGEEGRDAQVNGEPFAWELKQNLLIFKKKYRLLSIPNPKHSLRKKNLCYFSKNKRCTRIVLVKPALEQAQPSSDPVPSRWLPRAFPALCLFLAAGSVPSDAFPTLFYLSPIAERITFPSAVQEMNRHKPF